MEDRATSVSPDVRPENVTRAAIARPVGALFCLLPVPCTKAFTPFGMADTLKVTAPVNPPKSVIVIGAAAVEFWFKKTLAGPAMVKPLLLTAVLIALAYCAARPVPTKSS